MAFSTTSRKPTITALTAVICLVLSLATGVSAFVPGASTSTRFGYPASMVVTMASSVMDSPRRSASSFEDRMRNMVLGKRRKRKQAQANLPANVKLVANLDDYKKVVGGERDRIVVVRFFAPWCKACKAIQPLFYRLAHKFSNVLFVEVAVTERNANLHQGLGIPSLPFGHIYSPQGGLVEELKITRPHFSAFAHKLQSYETGLCELKGAECSSPYERKELSKATAV